MPFYRALSDIARRRVKDPDVAMELVGDVAMRIIAMLRVDPASADRLSVPYVRQMLRHREIDSHRRESRREVASGLLFEAEDVGASDPESVLSRTEQVEAVKRVMQTLVDEAARPASSPFRASLAASANELLLVAIGGPAALDQMVREEAGGVEWSAATWARARDRVYKRHWRARAAMREAYLRLRSRDEQWLADEPWLNDQAVVEQIVSSLLAGRRGRPAPLTDLEGPGPGAYEDE